LSKLPESKGGKLWLTSLLS